MNFKKKLLSLIVLSSLVFPGVREASAAISATSIWEMNAGATANNVNGGFFNPQNANFMTDLTTDANTGNTSAPVVSSASYNFVAGDVGHWLYIQSGTNWYPGWYKIASVASNKATLSAAVGSASVVQVSNRVTGTAQGTYGPNTAVGIASVGTPTSGVFGIDYSQGTASIIGGSDLACADGDAAAPALTSAGTPFGLNHVGNGIRISSGTGYTNSIYEIVSVSGTTATADRAVGTDGAKTGGVFNVGGAISMNSAFDDAIIELCVAGNKWFAKNNGAISTGSVISLTIAGTVATVISLEGYNTQRGDAPTGSNRPTMNVGANYVAFGSRWNVSNMIFTGTGSSASFALGSNSKNINCKSTNTSTSASRDAISMAQASVLINSEAVSYRGSAITCGNVDYALIGCWIHDSNIGIEVVTSQAPFFALINNIFSNFVTNVVFHGLAPTGLFLFHGNTFYGAENKLGVGIDFITGSGTNTVVINNIITGFVTGIEHADAQSQGYDDYNDYYNNTNDVSSNDEWQKGVNDVAVNPAFTSVTQITGTAATSSTNVLTDGTKDFTALGVTTSDFVYIVSGTGTGLATNIFAISAVGTTTLTLSSNITTSGSGTDIVYQLTLGNNYLPTGAV